MLKNVLGDEELKIVFQGKSFNIALGKSTHMPGIFELFNDIKTLYCYDTHFDIDKKIDNNIETLQIRLYG